MQEQEKEQKSNAVFESDTQKIIRRHLENKDDKITDEDIRNVRIGMSPPLDDIADAELEERLDSENNGEQKTNDDAITPWDTLKE